MKKLLAFALAMVLALSLAACGKPAEDGAQDSTTTVTTTTTAAAGEDTTTTATTAGTVGSDTTATTVTTTTQEPTTSYVPGGATVPIGTRPPTTTTTKKPTATTTTTTQGDAPVGPTTTVTTTTTTTTTTTSTTVKPTQPPVSGPYIALPEIGSDIDVTKKKNRIRVSAVAAWFNENGSIGVSLTFKNYTTNWITEETDYVTYVCYDKDGNVVQKATNLMIGVIDTKKHPVKEFVFEVPANTSEVRITKSKITYWTEWA